MNINNMRLFELKTNMKGNRVVSINGVVLGWFMILVSYVGGITLKIVFHNVEVIYIFEYVTKLMFLTSTGVITLLIGLDLLNSRKKD